MITKHTVLSFAFCTLIVSSTLASMISHATTSTQEITEPAQEATALSIDTANQEIAPQKSSGQRIVSGLAHTALLMPSLLYLACVFLEIKAQEKIAFAILGTRVSYGAAKGIYNAIAKSKVTPEKPTELNKWTTAESALLIPSLFILSALLEQKDTRTVKLLLSLPAVYALGTSLKTIYKLAHNHRADLQNASSGVQEQEIHTITQ